VVETQQLTKITRGETVEGDEDKLCIQGPS